MQYNYSSVYLQVSEEMYCFDWSKRLKTKSREIHKQSRDWITRWNNRNQRTLMGTVALQLVLMILLWEKSETVQSLTRRGWHQEKHYEGLWYGTLWKGKDEGRRDEGLRQHEKLLGDLGETSFTVGMGKENRLCLAGGKWVLRNIMTIFP